MGPKSNASKRKTGIRRTIAKAIHMSPLARSHVLSDFIDLPEEILMAREEMDQTAVDSFWGIDKDLRDRNAELQLMLQEVLLIFDIYHTNARV